MQPRAPTKGEIQTAYDAITKDGPGRADALAKAILPTSERWLKTFLDSLPEPVSVSDIANAAMAYGLNLGIRIGHDRTY